MGKPIRFPVVAAFMESWNRITAGSRLKQCAVLNDARKRSIATALTEGDLGQWQNAMEALAKWPYANGQNETGWRAGIDYILRPAHRARWLEAGIEEAEDEARQAARQRRDRGQAIEEVTRLTERFQRAQEPAEMFPCTVCGKPIVWEDARCFGCSRKKPPAR